MPPDDEFKPQADSPLADAGTDVGLTEDFDGDAVPYGSTPDIGAEELQQAQVSSWQDRADQHVNTPVCFVTIAFNSGTRYYSHDYVRTSSQGYKGNILSLGQIRSSVGDIRRTYERGRVTIIFNDSDYEFRSLETSESPHFKNRVVTITMAFKEDDYTETLTLYTGQIYDWRRLDDLRYEFIIEEQSHSLDNKYPDKLVEVDDYASAHESAIGEPIPIPYGAISANGLSGDGAFGWPSLANGTGLAFVDTTQDAEQHLVGRQTAAITVDRVYKNDVLQTEGAGDDYQVSTQVIDGFTHTEIHWVAANRPTESDKITCDITFGSRLPVEAIRHFLENFTPHVTGDFNSTSYSVAHTLETDRAYTFAGAITEEKELRSLLDDWRNEFELDIYWNTDGEICWRYMSTVTAASANHYLEYLHILKGFDSDPQATKIINYLRYGYNYHYGKAYYYNYSYYESSISQTKYGETYKDFIGFQWIRSAAMASDIAGRKIARFKDPITFDSYPFPLKAFSENLADAIKITHFMGVGSAGYSNRVFQIRDVNIDVDRLISVLYLEDTEEYMGNFCQLGDRSALAATWLLATDTDKDYLYLCDDSVDPGVFSDGGEGKQFFD